jgi:small-conductance mechanosensitive channel
MFLTVGGAVLLLLGIVGFLNIFTEDAYPWFWLDGGENVAHAFLGIVALAAVYVPGLNSALAPYYRPIVILVGLIALFFGVYGFVVAGDTSGANTFGLSNLESPADNILHLVVAAWAFASAFMGREPSMA